MRPHIFVLTALALAAAGALSGCAFDQMAMTEDETQYVTVEPVDVTPAQITRYADANRDGQVTREEARADPALAASFEHYDLDQNGKLDRGEFARLEDDTRDRMATTSLTSGSDSQRWMVEKPGGYFGPERGESLNRTGVRQSRPEDLE